MFTETVKAEGKFSLSYVKLNEFHREKKYTDVNLIVGEKTFTCHRIILASASDYFDALFGGDFMESHEENVTLNNIDVGNFENVLNYVYTGELRISRENAYDLLNVACFFGIRSMEELCVSYMEKNTPSRCIFEACMFADAMGKAALLAKIVQYIAENFVLLSKDDLFLRVSYNVLKSVLEHPNLQRIEDLILDFIIRWMNYNNERKCEAAGLLKSVQSGSITADYLAKLILHDVKLSKLFVQSIYHLNKANVVEEYALEDDKWISKQCYKAKFDVKNVIVNGHHFALSLLGWRSNAEAVNEFAVREGDQWRTLRPPPYGVTTYQLTAVYNTVYLYKGDVTSCRIYDSVLYSYYKNNNKSDFLFAYVYDLNKWFSVPKPKVETYNSCVASMNNLLYLLGGSKYTNTLDRGEANLAQCYDHRSPCWIPLPNMSFDRIYGAACCHNEKLYVSGGESNALEVFDPVAGRWEILESMQYLRAAHALVSHRNGLWAIGRKSTNPVEVYYPEVNNWKEMAFGKNNGKIVDAFVL